MTALRTLLVFLVGFLLLAFTGTALGSSLEIRRGSPVRTKSFDIGIESHRLENDSSGLIYYALKARVKNRTKRTLKASFAFQALDCYGQELDDVYLSNQIIEGNSTKILTDKNVMQRKDYDKIWEWEIVEIRLKNNPRFD